MAKYTLELRTIINSNIDIFNYDYDFYEPKLKDKFEQLFKDNYYFNEIGFETIERFKHNLKSKLNLIAPYYAQLYQTELAAKDIDFLLNKDLVEKTIRELDELQNSDTLNNSQNKSSDSYKESSVDNGNASVSLTTGDLTTVNSNSSENKTDSNTKTDSKIKTNEIVTFSSQGNIGVTSSAELLIKWRDTILNINKMIIEECADLFMQVY